MFQVRIHGRGGQGVVTAAEVLSVAAYLEGKHAQAFPSFGSERKGAPVIAFCRIDDKEIRLREPILEPDALIVQDPTLFKAIDVCQGLKPSGYLLVNSNRSLHELHLDKIAGQLLPGHALTVPASELALKHIGRPLPNAALLGAFAALTGIVHLKSVVAAIHDAFESEKIAKANIAKTCTKCHAQIETVHRKIIKGELWEKEANMLPACVDCHQPHKVRKVYYDQGMADKDCMRCHENKSLTAKDDGRSLSVNAEEVSHSRHTKVSCSQCHAGVNASRVRPCETISQKVDCASCHAEIGQQYQKSRHGQLTEKHDPNAPTCKECHGGHAIKGKADPQSATFATNVPDLCARCHREGNKAAVRYAGTQHEIIERYTESIHGKGLMKSGLTVTAMCTNCHTAHGELPKSDPASVTAWRAPISR